MNELIWFSIPGALVVFALGLTVPVSPKLLKDSMPIVIVAIPVIGFIVHQLWRTIFEGLFGGWASKRRAVIKDLMKKYDLGNIDAFLVWELTFYSNNIPDSFRQHDRGAWHYIMSFSSCALASFIALVIVCFGCFSYQFYAISLFAFILIMFTAKAITSRRSLYRQEQSIVVIYEKKFEETVNELKKIS